MRKTAFFIFSIFYTITVGAQQKIENIIIITTDGLRWQEVFTGMDSAIANSSLYNQGDSAYISGALYNSRDDFMVTACMETR